MSQPTWLLTGGAGYIGSHTVRAFQAAGIPVVVLDDLSTGFRAFVPDDVPFVHGSITEPADVRQALDLGVTGIVHLGGFKYAGVSVDQPLHCYHQNVTGMQVLLEATLERGIDRFVFSSSSSVYGTPDVEVVGEDAETSRPESPYGESKLISEWLLRNVGTTRPAFRHTSLRYFNVVGSGPPELADHSPHNLFPRILKALTSGERPTVFGTDYPTRDGTCIRDYVHVVDLADAHVMAAARLDAGEPCQTAYNIGRGEGTSVLEIMDAMRAATGIAFEPELLPRRPGDPTRIIGSTARLEQDFGWRATRDVQEMASSAWAAWQHQLATHGGPPGA
ncbi:UDP-glucose 4-epimerase [Paraconexibacter sp. AEG42_29]|uniref:UDP-glucose 4-epimerase n=1 Tax=Paraconexibacter sp. AEG42_29 TaxID=2997339 RepID=A0AAU7B2H7_9ACTN